MYAVKQEIIQWLMEDNNPPVKYLTQTNLLEVDSSKSDVVAIKNKINNYEPIAEILNKQIDSSYWFDKGKTKNYKKYLGSFWQVIFLSELHAQKNEQIENGIEHIYSTGQSSNGGFSMTGTNRGAITCLTANIVRALYFFGYGEDERTKKAVKFLLAKIEDGEGLICYPLTSLIQNCFMTIPKVIHALGSIPVNERTSRVQKGIDHCVKLLLDNNIYKYVPEENKEWLKYITDNNLKGQQLFEERNKFLDKYPTITKIAKPGWTKFGFPLNYNSDILDAMRSLAAVDQKYSTEMDQAIEILKSKSTEGKWLLEKQYKSPMHTQIEKYKKESKWITYHSLAVLKHFEGIQIKDE